MNIDKSVYSEELKGLGMMLRQAREGVCMSLDMVAEELGVTPSTVSKIERGQWNVSVGYLIALSKIYGIRLTFAYSVDHYLGNVSLE